MGKQWKVSDFIFIGSKITADGDCSHEIKRRLLLGRKVMINLDSIFKSRDITLPTKVHLVKAMVFPVVMYGCKSWTVKKAECQIFDAFGLWYWRRLLRVLSTLATSCEELTHRKRLWCWEGLGQEEKGTTGDEMAGWHHWHHWLDVTDWVWVNCGSWWWTGRPGVLRFMGSQRVGHD